MTAGLATSCEQKSILYKQYINTGTDESRVKFITYRNRLKSLLTRAENDYYYLKLKNCNNDQKRLGKLLIACLIKTKETQHQLVNSK